MFSNRAIRTGNFGISKKFIPYGRAKQRLSRDWSALQVTERGSCIIIMMNKKSKTAAAAVPSGASSSSSAMGVGGGGQVVKTEASDTRAGTSQQRMMLADMLATLKEKDVPHAHIAATLNKLAVEGWDSSDTAQVRTTAHSSVHTHVHTCTHMFTHVHTHIDRPIPPPLANTSSTSFFTLCDVDAKWKSDWYRRGRCLPPPPSNQRYFIQRRCSQ